MRSETTTSRPKGAKMTEALGIEDILKLLPHRYPFILVDRIIDVLPEKKIVALKNVSINEPFFQGHFPDRPIMPGVLILEGMVQAAALLLGKSLPADVHDRVCFTGIDKARFRLPVVPGDQLIYEIQIKKQRSRVIQMDADAFVGARRAAEAELMVLIGGRK
jgi:3-hydroxyacyl-[acyl-carrier-protein] dehydratase